MPALSPRGTGARKWTLPAGYFGVSPATRLSAAEYEAMGTGAIGTLRHPFFWEDIQPIGRVHFDWRKTDAVVENATVNGVPVLPYVMGSPGWLRNGATSSDHPLPDQRAAEAWAELLTRLRATLRARRGLLGPVRSAAPGSGAAADRGVADLERAQ